MWFFGNSKSLGFIFELVGLIMLITSVLYITEGYAEVGISLPPTVSDVSSYCLLIGFGGLVASIIYIVNAHRIMIGTVSKKVDVLSKYIVTVGITTFFASGAEYLASYLYDREPYDIWFIITLIVVCIIVVVVGRKIGNGKPSRFKNALRYILMIAFIIMLIDSLLPSDNYLNFCIDITHMIISIFMLLFLLDAEVKAELGGLVVND